MTPPTSCVCVSLSLTVLVGAEVPAGPVRVLSLPAGSHLQPVQAQVVEAEPRQVT